MRVVKEAEERRNEILDAADELFGAKGFDKTSTNDILEAVGIARGTLYYHFKSKEDIMDALIERYNVRLLEGAKAAAAQKEVPLEERLVRAVLALNLSGGSAGSGKELIEHIHKPQNALMHQKIQRIVINNVAPILAELIQEGIDTGMFRTPYPYESTEMIVVYANTVVGGEMVELTEDERAERVRAFIFNAERLLGTEAGALAFFSRMFGIESRGGHE